MYSLGVLWRADLTYISISREGEDVYLRCAVEGRPDPHSLQFSKDVSRDRVMF
jgi:hypothetical protein